jgi:hypothetical protein
MLSVTNKHYMLSVIMLNVVMLSVVMPVVEYSPRGQGFESPCRWHSDRKWQKDQSDQIK